MKRELGILTAAAVVALAVWASPQAAGQADAAGCVQIYRIYFDSPGDDTGSNTSRNAEWIQLKNRCANAKSLSGWKIKDTSGHVYSFGTYRLGAGNTVKVHTGSGTNTASHRYWGSQYYIWNNEGDKATLKNAAGTIVDTCRYSGAGSSVYC